MNRSRVLARWACICAVTFVAPNARGEPLGTRRAEGALAGSGERFSAQADVRLGATNVPYFTRDFPEVRGHGMVSLLRAAYRPTDRHSVSAEVPLLAMNVRQPAGAYLNEFAWGNLNLAYRFDHVHLDTPRLRLVVHTGASIALPIAEQSRSASLLSGRALRIGSALDGFRHPELYTEGVLPVAGSVGVGLRRGWFAAAASLRLPLLMRFSDADLPKDARTHPLGVATVLHVGMAADATRWLNIAFAADTALDAVSSVETARHTARGQLTLSWILSFQLPRGVGLGGTFWLPVAGALGGSTYAGGLSLEYHR